MKPILSSLIFLVLEILAIATINISFCNGSSHVGCIESERQALLRFKQDLIDPSKRQASWIGNGDCCTWAGVVCNNLTGHVLELQLRNPLKDGASDAGQEAAYESSQLIGKINPSLLDLKHLIYLDLSGNNFGVQIPKFLGSVRNLRYLNLSRAGFIGMIPPQLGNLSNLQYLDLSDLQDLDLRYSGSYVENFSWLSGLSLLKYLDFSGVTLIQASDWLLVTNSLPSLVVLRLSYCQLYYFPLLPIANISSLSVVDLSQNLFNASLIPRWILGLNHLVFLDLSDNNWNGPISDTLQNMTSLKYLDLSNNLFNSAIPDWLSRFSRLEYLDLSLTSLAGLIPHQLGNLTNLQYLKLDQNVPNRLYANNLYWLSGLSLLQHLDLSGVDLSKVSDWLLMVNTLPSLVVLQLSHCKLHRMPLIPTANFSSLDTLVLSFNQFDNSTIPSWVLGLSNLVSLDLGDSSFKGPIPDELHNLTSLRFLSMSSNSLQGKIPDAIGNLTSMTTLDLSQNGLEGTIPKSLGRLCNLESISISHVKLSQEISEIIDILSGCIADGLGTLDLENSQLSGHLTKQLGQFRNLESLNLRDNSISGHIPASLGQLSSLQVLDFVNNKMEGTLTQIHFVNLTILSLFSVSGNSLRLKVNPDWVPPFQLLILELRSCYLGPHFPLWLLTQNTLDYLDISNSGIVDTISNRFWKFLFQIDYVNLSNNQIRGKIPNLTSEVSQIRSLDLSSNKFLGPLPLISLDIMFEINLSNNSLSGSISHFLCHAINDPRRTQILNLGDNILSGELPDCWNFIWQHLSVLNLGNNKFRGKIPASMGTLISLRSLNLQKNSLSGIIPMSLKNCAKLVAFNIAKNEFVGNIPTWIGTKFSRLIILNLRSNQFHGHFPKELCNLASLQILDLAENNLSGTIPRCINNFSAMAIMNYSGLNYITYSSYSTGKFVEGALLVVKGKEVEYNANLNLLRTMDLSKNNFSGVIPIEVTNLEALISLNLSHNFLSARIPENIGIMSSLESIDFSVNQLSGEIPQSISNLTFLNYLNLSYNKLVGKIPLSTQIQGFGASCFIGNELCGSPLPKNCSETTPIPDYEDGNEHKDGMDWLYLSMGLGFVVGFWGIVGPLLFIRRWRYVYYQFLDRLWDKLFHVVRRC